MSDEVELTWDGKAPYEVLPETKTPMVSIPITVPYWQRRQNGELERSVIEQLAVEASVHEPVVLDVPDIREHVPLGADVELEDFVEEEIAEAGGGDPATIGATGPTGPPGATGPAGATGAAGGAGTQLYQRMLNFQIFNVSTHSRWPNFPDDIHVFGGYYRATYDGSATAVGAYVEFDALLEAGSWQARIGHYANPDGGIWSIQVDGVEVGTVDTYAVALTQKMVNQTPPHVDNRAVVPFTVASGGNKKIRFAINSKNPSSSGYEGYLMAFDLVRTGA